MRWRVGDKDGGRVRGRGHILSAYECAPRLHWLVLLYHMTLRAMLLKQQTPPHRIAYNSQYTQIPEP